MAMSTGLAVAGPQMRALAQALLVVEETVVVASLSMLLLAAPWR